MPEKPKKKVDYEALNSPFMRIPYMPIIVARALIDLDIHQIYELIGRSPETILTDILKTNPKFPQDHLPHLKLAIYYAEHFPNTNSKLLHPNAWK
jgi:hypothetical protein